MSARESPSSAPVAAGSVRVIVRDPPPPEPDDEPWPAVQPPRAIVLPAGQSARDREGFLRWLHDQWGGFIRGRLLGRRDVLEESTKDLVQRVLLVVCDHHDGGAPPVNMRAFLDRVIQNEVCNHKRRWRPAIEPDAEPDEVLAPGPGPESAAERAERLEKLARYLTHLTPEEAEVLVAKEVEGMTFDAIATALERSRTTVARQHARALEKLQEMARASEREAALGGRLR